MGITYHTGTLTIKYLGFDFEWSFFPVAYFTEEVKPSLAKLSLKFNGG